MKHLYKTLRPLQTLIILISTLLPAAMATVNCHQASTIHCGISYQHDTKFGHSNNHDYRCFHHSLTGFHAKELIFRIDRSSIDYAHDLEIIFDDLDHVGLDIFVIENCGEHDARCHSYQERDGTGPERTILTIKDADPHKKYFVAIDAKSVTGRFRLRVNCVKKDFKCSFATSLPCGETRFGNTHDGEANYHDYRCFDHSLSGFHAPELIYKITDRPSQPHDIEITLEDLDDKGLDLFIIENCGEHDYNCYAYKIRNSASPQKEKLTLHNTDPHKEYYIVVDAKSATGRFNLSVFCEKDDFFCHNADEIACGRRVFGETNHGEANYHDYTCFHPDLSGFHAKELVYKVTERPAFTHDLTIVLHDIDNNGLDLFVIENCGKEDYRCVAYKERFGTSLQSDTLRLKNTNPHKDYHIIVDAKLVTGSFELTVFCGDQEFFCHDARNLPCGEVMHGNTFTGTANYHDYSCFDSGLKGFEANELVYRITGRPSQPHDIRIYLTDEDQVGLDLFVIEECGTSDFKCYAYKERFSWSPRTDKLTLENTDPHKDYYVVVDAREVTGPFQLEVECGEERSCFEPCFTFVRNREGRYDFIFPSGPLNGKIPHRWKFENVITGQVFYEPAGDLIEYRLGGNDEVYQVSVVDDFDQEICYLWVNTAFCSNRFPEAKAFQFEKDVCSLDFPSSSCSFNLDASSSEGADLIYHWFLNYENSSRNRQFLTFRPDTTIGVAYPDSLTSICLIISNSCGMSSYCWQGRCSYTESPRFEIEEAAENEVILNLLNSSVPCTSSVSRVEIDWGDGTVEEFDLHKAWDFPETYPRHQYDHPGNYYICVKVPYRCDESQGDFENRKCDICFCRLVSVGKKEDNHDCDYLNIHPGPDINSEKRRYYVSLTDIPSGYKATQYYYRQLNAEPSISWNVTDSVDLDFGRSYEICVLLENLDNGETFKCCRSIFVDYPTQHITLIADDVCGALGDTVDVPIRVLNFRNVTGMQFRIDVQSHADLIDAVFYNDELPVGPDDILIDHGSDRLQFAWSSPQSDEARSLLDESILFVLKVRVGGSTADTSMVSFSDALAFNNLTNQEFEVNSRKGKICAFANFTLSGKILVENGGPVDLVAVRLNGPAPMATSSESDGKYEFRNLPPAPYSLHAFKEDDFRRGVNVIDLAILKAYNRSFGEEGLNGPYQRIAANLRRQLDADNISVADETEMRRLISFDIDELEEYDSPWIFIPSTHVFGDETVAQKEDYPTEYEYDPLSESKVNQDFVAVKLGDLDGSAGRVDSRARSADLVSLSFSDQTGEMDSVIQMDLKASGFEQIQNMQFTIQWDPSVLAFVQVTSAFEALGLEESSFSTRFIDEGKLTFVHSIAPAAVTFADSSIFSIEFRLIGAEGSTSMVEVVSDPVEILITDASLRIETVNVEAGNVTVGSLTPVEDQAALDFDLGVNYPNPFAVFTTVPITMEHAEMIHLSVFNIKGQVVYEMDEFLQAGEHAIRIPGSDLGAAGIYHLVLRSKSGQTTQKMQYQPMR